MSEGRDGSRRLLLVALRLQGMQVVERALGMCCRREDGTLVVAQNLQPAIEIACVVGAWFELWDDAEIGAEKRAAEFGNQFLAGTIAPVFGVAAEIAIKPLRCAGPVNFMPISA